MADELKATPRNRLAQIADAIMAGKEALNAVTGFKVVPNLGEMLLGQGPEEIERWSYGSSPFKQNYPGVSPRYPELSDPRKGAVVDAMMLAPVVGASKAPVGMLGAVTSYRVGKPKGLWGTWWGSHVPESGFREYATSNLPDSGKDILNVLLRAEEHVTGGFKGAPAAAAAIENKVVLDPAVRKLFSEGMSLDQAVAIQAKKDGYNVIHFRQVKDPARVVSLDLREHSLEELIKAPRNRR